MNLTVVPAWLLLIFMPRWKWTRIIAAYAVPAALAIVYLTLLLMNKPPEGAGFGSINQVERLFSSQWLLLAGWVHYLAFDLFVGAWQVRDDQQYTMNADGSDVRRVSSGEGRTTCGYFAPGGREIVYASTHGGGPECPARPDMSRGYVWPIYPAYDIYRGNADGSNLRNITNSPGYDAEPTIGPDGRIVFTSVRHGDMEIYSMNGDGSDVRRLTNRVGPDGGPFFSKDGSKIVFRGRTLTAGPELDRYSLLLKEGLWQPTSLEIFVMNRDGSGLRQVTKSAAASFAPFFHPDGKRIIFSSNITSQQGRGEFDLYMIDEDGSGLERVTYAADFDGFPMWSPDGKTLVFASNRNAAKPGDTNIFIADWID